MKDLRMTLLIPAVLFGAALLPVVAHADNDDHHRAGINARLHHQNARIEQGERNGSLTYRESERLEARDARIRHQEYRDRHSGGKFTEAERRRLRREENRTSGAIYRQKHDAQHRHY